MNGYLDLPAPVAATIIVVVWFGAGVGLSRFFNWAQRQEAERQRKEHDALREIRRPDR